MGYTMSTIVTLLCICIGMRCEYLYPSSYFNLIRIKLTISERYSGAVMLRRHKAACIRFQSSSP